MHCILMWNDISRSDDQAMTQDFAQLISPLQLKYKIDGKTNSSHTLIIVIAEYMKPNMTKSGIIREIISMAKLVV